MYIDIKIKLYKESIYAVRFWPKKALKKQFLGLFGQKYVFLWQKVHIFKNMKLIKRKWEYSPWIHLFRWFCQILEHIFFFSEIELSAEIWINSLWNSLSKNVHFWIVYFISFQVMVKIKLTKNMGEPSSGLGYTS